MASLAAILIAGAATLATSQGLARVSGSESFSVELTPDAPIAVRDVDITYDATKVPAPMQGSVVAKVPDLDDRVRVIAMPLVPAEVGSRRNLRLEDDGRIFESRADCSGNLGCSARTRLVFELVDMAVPVTVSGSIEWRADYSTAPANAGPDPMTIHVSEPASDSLAVDSTSGTTGRQSVRLTKDAFVTIYDVSVAFDLGAASDEAIATAVLANLRIHGASLNEQGEAPARFTIYKPGQNCCGAGGPVVDGTSADIRPISGCVELDCGRTVRVTFEWTGAQEVVEFDWELESTILAYGAPLPENAVASAKIDEAWAVAADAPRIEATLKGDFEMARRGDQARKIVDWKTALSGGATGDDGDPRIPAFAFLSLRAVQAPGAAPSDEVLDLNVQGAGDAHVPVDGSAVTLAFNPIDYCQPGTDCKEDGIFVFFRRNELGDGPPVRIEWELTMRASSFDGEPLPAAATISVEFRQVNR